MTEKLEPCPFCGGKGALEAGHFLTWVACLSCCARGPVASRAEAIRLWNTRKQKESTK